MNQRILLLLLFGSACAQGAEDGRHLFGSQAIATSSDFRALYVVDTEAGDVSVVHLATSEVTHVGIAGEPARIARAGDRVFVTLRAARGLAVYRESSSGLTHEQTIALGAEPFGVVADERGTSIYVAVSLEDRVVELDATTLEEKRTWSVAGEPRWLAIHPSGRHLYVGSARGGRITAIPLDSAGAPQPIALPVVANMNLDSGVSAPLAPRVTGDPAVTPDGDRLLVPMLIVDNTTPVEESDEGDEQMPGGGYEGGRFNPVVASVPLGSDGEVDGDAALVMLNPASPEPVRGYPASVTVSPDSERMVVTIEGAGAVLVAPVDFEEPDGDRPVPVFGRAVGPGPGAGHGDVRGEKRILEGMQFAMGTVVTTGAGPRAVAFVEDSRAFVYAFLDHQVASFEVDGVEELSFEERIELTSRSTGASITLRQAVGLDGEARLIDEGRRLFYASNDARVSQPGAGVSCATCHFDGRDDGLTWAFDRGPRQTPSLAGKVSLTAPVRWEGDRTTVAEDAMMTSQGLMGGVGLTEADTIALAAFIDSTREVDVPLRGAADERVARGQAIFERADVNCTSCHNGERYTNNAIYSMFGLARVKTRSLVGVAASAPYLHDGSAATLRDVLLRARSGEMGNTGSLSEAELADLEAYLSSL